MTYGQTALNRCRDTVKTAPFERWDVRAAMAKRIASLALAFSLAAQAAPAWADCESGVATLTPLLARASEPHLRQLLEADLKQAQIDLWEFDEVECAIALEHAMRLIVSVGGIAKLSAPSTGN